MGILDQLLGGGQLRQGFEDFVNRYEQGHPAEGHSDQEVIDRAPSPAQARVQRVTAGPPLPCCAAR